MCLVTCRCAVNKIGDIGFQVLARMRIKEKSCTPDIILIIEPIDPIFSTNNLDANAYKMAISDFDRVMIDFPLGGAKRF
jgi:hypothetical protein